MQEDQHAPKHYFAHIDANRPDEVVTGQIADAVQLFKEEVFWPNTDAGGDVTLSGDDAIRLHGWTQDDRINVRKVAIGTLCEVGPLAWDDLEVWALDPDEEVRETVLMKMDAPFDPPLCQLLTADPQRFIHLLALVTERYVDFSSMWALIMLSKNSTYLDLVWVEINRLIDLDSQDINTSIQVQYLEDIIPEYRWGPDDPHLAAWIQGNDITRQVLLLITASWIGLHSAKFKEIVAALSHAQDLGIAELAQQILAGTVRFNDATGWFVDFTSPS